MSNLFIKYSIFLKNPVNQCIISKGELIMKKMASFIVCKADATVVKSVHEDLKKEDKSLGNLINEKTEANDIDERDKSSEDSGD